MNKLLKVTLITAIMAASGMCSMGYQPYQAFPQQAPQQDSCGPMVKLALGAAAGYAVYKMCDGHHDNNEKIAMSISNLTGAFGNQFAKGSATIDTGSHTITLSQAPSGDIYFKALGKDVMIAPTKSNDVFICFSSEISANDDGKTYNYRLKNPSDIEKFNELSRMCGNQVFVTTPELARAQKYVVDHIKKMEKGGYTFT